MNQALAQQPLQSSTVTSHENIRDVLVQTNDILSQTYNKLIHSKELLEHGPSPTADAPSNAPSCGVTSQAFEARSQAQQLFALAEEMERIV